MKIINRRLMLRPIHDEVKTASGLIIASYEPQSKYVREVYPNMGEVIALDEKIEDIMVGDIVVFYRWGAEIVELENEEVYFVSEKDILAKVEYLA